jgi:hypothetical protein
VSEDRICDLILALPDDLSTATWALLLVLHAETLGSSGESSTSLRRPCSSLVPAQDFGCRIPGAGHTGSLRSMQRSWLCRVVGSHSYSERLVRGRAVGSRCEPRGTDDE